MMNEGKIRALLHKSIEKARLFIRHIVWQVWLNIFRGCQGLISKINNLIQNLMSHIQVLFEQGLCYLTKIVL